MIKHFLGRIGNLSIRYKLTLGLGLLLVFAFAMVAINFFQQDRQNTARLRADDAREVATLAENLRAEVSAVQFRERSFFLRRMVYGYSGAYPDFEQALVHFDNALTQAVAISAILPDDEQDQITQIADGVREYRDTLSDIVEHRIAVRGDPNTGRAEEVLTALADLQTTFAAVPEYAEDNPVRFTYDAARDYVLLPDGDSIQRFNLGIVQVSDAVDTLEVRGSERTRLRGLISTAEAGFVFLVGQDALLWRDMEGLETITIAEIKSIEDFVDQKITEHEDAAAELGEMVDLERKIQLAMAAALLLIGPLLGILIARSITQPIEMITRVAQKMTGGDYAQRITHPNADEFGHLAGAFNEMAESIQKHEQELRDQAARLVESNANLEIARQQAVDSNRLKSEFVATMSHELRTPLNAVIGYSQIILSGMAGELNEKMQRFMERIFNNSTDLLRLIDDILDLSKIDAGRLDMVQKTFLVDTWLAEVVAQVAREAEVKNLPIERHIDPQMPATLYGDPDRLKQIAVNLLSNAIKFTTEGHVMISLLRRERSSWEIAVSDTGVGIPSHAQEYIFERFRQVDGSSRRKYGGTGLGLAIVRQLALMMGGTVRLHSMVDEGSTFTVRLPLGQPEPATAPDAAPAGIAE